MIEEKARRMLARMNEAERKIRCEAVARLCSGCELHIWVGDSDNLASFLDIDGLEVRMLDIESGAIIADVEQRIANI